MEQQHRLPQQQEDVEESQQVTGRRFGRVVPERVDQGPGEEVAMIFPDHVDHATGKRSPPTQQDPATGVLQHQDHHQHQRDRSQGRDLRNIPGQPVVPQMGLQQVQAGKQHVDGNHRPVEPTKPALEFRLPSPCQPDHHPGRQVVQAVAQPGGQPRHLVGSTQPPGIVEGPGGSHDLKSGLQAACRQADHRGGQPREQETRQEGCAIR